MVEGFIDGLFNKSLSFKILERNPQLFETAVKLASDDQNLRKMFQLRNTSNIENEDDKMEVDHARNKKFNFCHRFGCDEKVGRKKLPNITYKHDEVRLTENKTPRYNHQNNNGEFYKPIIC